MIESDVILVDGIPRESYNQIIKKGLEYAIISIPFTYDRMGIPDLVQKIINIAKGKVAEAYSNSSVTIMALLLIQEQKHLFIRQITEILFLMVSNMILKTIFFIMSILF